MPKKISYDRPLQELTLRKYEKPYNLSDRELIKKICLSLGLLQPGDSRDVIVDVFNVLLKHAQDKVELTSKKITSFVVEERKNNNLPLIGIASSNIRRQLKRLRELHLVEKIENNYRITEFEKIASLFEKRIKKFILPAIVERIEEYLNQLDRN